MIQTIAKIAVAASLLGVAAPSSAQTYGYNECVDQGRTYCNEVITANPSVSYVTCVAEYTQTYCENMPMPGTGGGGNDPPQLPATPPSGACPIRQPTSFDCPY